MKITLFYDHVTVLDYAFLDSHLGAVGNSLIVDVEFIGHTDHEGVVYDFSYAKKKVKEIIDRDCDHRFVIPKGMLAHDKELLTFNYNFGPFSEAIKYRAPAQAFCEIPFRHVSYETVTAYLEERIMLEMPNTVEAVKIHLREEKLDSDQVVFHYTHGLRDHYGNCQRLLHGHRNTIEVWVNGNKRSDLEKNLVTELFSGNIHFCYWDNVVNKDEVITSEGRSNPEGRVTKTKNVQIKYQASQGEFIGEFPGTMIYILPIETTVENLSLYFAQLLKSQLGKQDIVRVRAFEGIGKGAISTM